MAGSPQHATLVANTVAPLTFDYDFGRVEITTDGAADLYVTTDGTTPSIAGTGSHWLPAGMGSVELPAARGAVTVVKLISPGTPKVSVRGL